MHIELDPEQTAVIEQICAWADDPCSSHFILTGQAGTGKTTVIARLRSRLSPVYSAYTNKATHLLRLKGCHPAATLHMLLKVPLEEPTQGLGFGAPYRIVERFGDDPRVAGKLVRSPAFDDKEVIGLEAHHILIVDEASMLDREMARSILRLPNPVIIVMDPFQLPPIGSDRGYFLKYPADATLETVHRAKNPGVLDIATYLRKYKRYPPFGQYDNSSIRDFFDRPSEWRQAHLDPMLLAADQIICGFNQSRILINRRVRELNGLAKLDPDNEGMPVIGDKIICYRNGNAARVDGHGHSTVINGSMWKVTSASKCRTEDAAERPFMLLELASIDNPNARPIRVRVPREYFWLRYPDKYAQNDGGWDVFTFGYAITCHKAQGSEWPNVLVIDHSWARLFKPYQWQWIYTATTRASHSTHIIRGPWS